ncbi:MAG: TIGR04076 family protein [Chloroflexi bacterium]|nr:TIGR04076 family protein [Chloroflexota bacterium]
MDEGPKVQIRVARVRRRCPLGHKVGDSWEMGATTPEGICMYAFLAIAPAWSALRTGGRFGWEEDPDVVHFACPDQGEVVFELRRVDEAAVEQEAAAAVEQEAAPGQVADG